MGTAKDCRLHVQKLNGMRGEIDELRSNLSDEENKESEHVPCYIPVSSNKVTVSKWSNYVEPPETNESFEEKSNDEGMSLGDAQVVLELPKKRKRFNTVISQKNTNVKVSRHSDVSDKLQEVRPSNKDCDSPHPVFSEKQNLDIAQTENSYSTNIYERLVAKDKLTTKSITKKKFTPPVLNKNSKWAQFTDNNDEIDEGDQGKDIAPSASITMSQNDLMFSLCEDDDWDNILEI